jgi:hypothetical protein
MSTWEYVVIGEEVPFPSCPNLELSGKEEKYLLYPNPSNELPNEPDELRK